MITAMSARPHNGMPPTTVTSILAALMCTAAVAGSSYKVGPEPSPWVHFPGVDFRECAVDEPPPPCATNENVSAGSLECAYPNETTFRQARSQAVALDEARLRSAVADLNLKQAVWAWRRIGRTEQSYDAFYSQLKDYWASGSELAPPWSPPNHS